MIIEIIKHFILNIVFLFLTDLLCFIILNNNFLNINSKILIFEKNSELKSNVGEIFSFQIKIFISKIMMIGLIVSYIISYVMEHNGSIIYQVSLGFISLTFVLHLLVKKPTSSDAILNYDEFTRMYVPLFEEIIDSFYESMLFKISKLILHKKYCKYNNEKLLMEIIK